MSAGFSRRAVVLSHLLGGWRRRDPNPLLALLLLCALPACQQLAGGGPEGAGSPRDHAAASVPEAPAPAEGAPTAVARTLAAGERLRVLTIDTSLVVDRDVAVMARMTGIVEEILADRGSRVRKGDVLLTLMNRDLRLALQRGEITARQRKAEFDRAQQLFEERALSQSQFDEAKFALEGAEVDAEIAREALEKSFIRAPFDGVIVERAARVGQKVVEDTSETLFRLTALSPLQARLYLTEEVARSLQPGDTVGVRPRYLADAATQGTIEWISRVIDPSSGTSQAIVSVPGGGKGLAPGTAVTITLSLPGPGAGVVIPPAALEGGAAASSNRTARVEVAEDGKRVWRMVRLGDVQGDEVQVLEGLRPGERVFLTHGGDPAAVESR